MAGDFAIAVDTDWRTSYKRGRYTDFVSCDKRHVKHLFDQKVTLKDMGTSLGEDVISGAVLFVKPTLIIAVLESASEPSLTVKFIMLLPKSKFVGLHETNADELLTLVINMPE